jgi:four helix bundle protein
VYEATVAFPKQELYGLTGQVRRSAASVPTTIAEGCGRNGDAELARFLQIASGSASELEYHLLLAHDLKLLKTPEYETLGPRSHRDKAYANLIHSEAPSNGHSTKKLMADG